MQENGGSCRPSRIVATERAFGELLEETEDDLRRDNLSVACAIFVTVMGVGLRRSGILGLRWGHVALADPDGACLRVEETFVRSGIDTPKSLSSRRTVALGRKVAEVLFELRAQTAYEGDDDELVFGNPRTGNPFDVQVSGSSPRSARKGPDHRLRPPLPRRQTHLDHERREGGPQPRGVAGTRRTRVVLNDSRYIGLAGETFRAEAEQLERRLWGDLSKPLAEAEELI